MDYLTPSFCFQLSFLQQVSDTQQLCSIRNFTACRSFRFVSFHLLVRSIFPFLLIYHHYTFYIRLFQVLFRISIRKPSHLSNPRGPKTYLNIVKFVVSQQTVWSTYMPMLSASLCIIPSSLSQKCVFVVDFRSPTTGS